jgi:hypothetical protein
MKHPFFHQLSEAACGPEGRATGLTRGGDRDKADEPR